VTIGASCNLLATKKPQTKAAEAFLFTAKLYADLLKTRAPPLTTVQHTLGIGYLIRQR
jgi:hypothetical protein